MKEPNLRVLLHRIANALESHQTNGSAPPDLTIANAFVWQAQGSLLQPVPNVAHVDLALLVGIDRARDTLLDNTRRFAKGHAANNALLWGARGMGKSSLVKAAHAAINQESPGILVLVEIHREDLPTLPNLLAILAGTHRRCILFCDDLSFDTADISYKSLKAVLEGGLEGRPENVLFYATSNRRHLMPRDMIENERSTAINPAESVDEKVSLSDRFGLWLGFHACNQAEYLSMIEAYVKQLGLEVALEQLHADAIEWSVTRGARSGRVAWQFIQDLAGRQEKQV